MQPPGEVDIQQLDEARAARGVDAGHIENEVLCGEVTLHRQVGSGGRDGAAPLVAQEGELPRADKLLHSGGVRSDEDAARGQRVLTVQRGTVAA